MTPEHCRFTSADAALGIEVVRNVGDELARYFFRLVAPAPSCDWRGPYETPEAAHASAVRLLLAYARCGADGQRAVMPETDAGDRDDNDLLAPWRRWLIS